MGIVRARSVGDVKLAALAKKLGRGAQAQIATKVGVSQQTVSLWLSKKRRPSADHMKALWDAYGLSMSDWFRFRAERAA